MSTILIVDDESHIRTLTEAIFKGMGMDVVLAVDGADGIRKAGEIKPDIILTDVIMPNKNGFELCKAIRNDAELAHTPIIMISAMGDDYNKITGFEEGADDYVTKPFNIEELKARVKAILFRHQRSKLHSPNTGGAQSVENAVEAPDIEVVSTGIAELDDRLAGGIPRGSNILILGPIGKGKSSFGRSFIQRGLSNNDKCLFVAIDDAPHLIRQQMDKHLDVPCEQHIDDAKIQFVDAYSWSSLTPAEASDRFTLSGVLDLNQLSGAISDASLELGQSVQQKLGGRRIIDSISSLFINFELAAVQRFLTQISRTSIAFGNVTTLFILEEGTVSEQVLNNIKYVMDGVIEFNEVDGKRAVRAASMKWTSYTKDWVYL